MIYIEQLELIHKSGDVLYPVKITRKSSGKTAFHLVPFGLNKTHDLLEVEDASEAIRLVIDERHSIRCSTLTATITNKKGGDDSNLLIVFYVQIMPDDLVMQLHRF